MPAVAVECRLFGATFREVQFARTQFSEGHTIGTEDLIGVITYFHSLQEEGLIGWQGKFHQPLQVNRFRAIDCRNNLHKPMFRVMTLFLVNGFQLYGWMLSGATKTQVVACIFQACSRKAQTFNEENSSFRVEDKIQPGICQSGHAAYHLSRIAENGMGPSRSSFGSLAMQSMMVEACPPKRLPPSKTRSTTPSS